MNENIRMSPAFIKNKGWKMAESLEANGVLDGHALDFDIVDPNAVDDMLGESIRSVQSEYLKMPEDHQEEERTIIVEPTVEELIK